MKRYDLFVHGESTEFSGEWRHVGNFEAPDHKAAREVGLLYARQTGFNRLRVFTGRPALPLGRMIMDLHRISA